MPDRVSAGQGETRLIAARIAFYFAETLRAFSMWLYPTGCMRPSLRAALRGRVRAKAALRKG